ncbi:MAG: DUF294 nucleotidyltransferase-like domain-containing protein [Pseudomonadota bacterium]
MLTQVDNFPSFLASVHPYDTFSADELTRIAGLFQPRDLSAGDVIYESGAALDGLYLVVAGEVDVADAGGTQLSHLKPGNSFGERGLVRGGVAVTSATAASDGRVCLLPAAEFHALMEAHEPFRRFFTRGTDRTPAPRPNDLTNTRVETIMTRDPLTCAPETTILRAAQMMRDARVSSLCVVKGDRLAGIVTIRDLSGRVLAENRPTDAPVSTVMTADPETLPPTAIGSDVLHSMMELHIGHIPIAERGKLVGIVTQTDLTRLQAVNSAYLVGDISTAQDAHEIAKVTARIPQLLAQLVGAGNRHDVVTRLITDIADAATRRLLKLAEETLGPPPVPYLWLACGSQGRREQTGVSDQDNCLILDDSATEADDAYFAALAKFVSDGLDTCGYVYCPGDMMATASRWRQPLKVWRGYFEGWIATPSPEAQMLASVMFDLRPIGGTRGLFEDLQTKTLARASKNSIFVAHMVANSLKHRPPLGLLRGFATVRSGEHKNQIDMKMNGVVPIVDLARLYALMGAIEGVNTRARLEAAAEAGSVSKSGAQDLLDAYDLIAQTRLEHQAWQIGAGEAPDNYLAPTELSDFERSHLRDAFVVVRTMQSAVGQGKGTLG